MNEIYAQAICGQTVVIPYEEIKWAFLSMPDFENWLLKYGLQSTYSQETQSYTISKQ